MDKAGCEEGLIRMVMALARQIAAKRSALSDPQQAVLSKMNKALEL